MSIYERSLKTGFIVNAINSLNKTHTQLEQQLTINQHNNQINALEYIAAETTPGNCVRALLYLPDNIIYKSITLMYYNRLHAWWSTQSRLATLLSSFIARRWVGLKTLWQFRLKELSIDEMEGPDFWLFVGPTGVYLFDFFCSSIQFYLLLSPYLCFISLLYLDLYVLGDDALIS